MLDLTFFRAETWVHDKKPEKKLITFENKDLRKIFGSTVEADTWRIKHNHQRIFDLQIGSG